MDFIRRKSGPQAAQGGPHEEEPAPASRVRNRLSKPRSMNSNLKSSSSQLRLEALDTGAQHAEPRSEFDAVEPTQSGTDGPSTNPRVSDLITRLESNQKTSSQSPLPLTKRRDSYRGSMTSITEQKLASLTTSSLHPRLTTLKNDSRSTISPAQSVDDLSDLIPNFSRRSSFKPGAATRKSSQVEIIIEEPEPNKIMLQDDKPEQSYVVDDDARSFIEGDDEAWYPPPQVARPETPRSLIDYPHLGSLTPGSLQVTNGRASPTGSNMSKQLVSRQFSRQSRVRDVSSEYDQSVYDDQSLPASLNGDSVYSTKNRYRDFSWQSRGSSKLKNDNAPPMPGTEAASAADPASFLADEYMAELPTSPFAVRKSSLQNFAHRVALAGLEGSVRPESYLSYESADTHGDQRPSSPVPSVKSETGTILVTTTKTTETEDDLFEDEALGGSPTRDRYESTDSWHATNVVVQTRVQSVDGLDTEYAVDFASEDRLKLLQSVGDVQISKTMSSTTIEIDTTVLTPAQTAEIHEMDANGYESELRFHSPIELEPLSSWTPNSASPEPRKSFHKSDSGYSSNVSLRSSSGERKQSMSKVSSEVDRRSLVGKVFRPILKSRRTSTEVVTTRKSIDKARPTPVRAQTSIPASSETLAAAVVQVKKTNRLTKRLTSGRQFQPVVLQTIQSIDDLSIPPVSTEASEHLRIRTQAVPELESTYRSMDHVRNRLSVSTVSMLDDYPEIRFPSPEPERKQARRRSWFGKVVEDKPSKPEKPKPKYKSSKRDSWNVTDISQEHAMAIMNDWQSQAPSLGGSHYDQIPGRRNSMKLYQQQQQQQQQEPQQGLRRPSRLRQKKRNMDDKEAAELARYRSASIRERDAWNQQQPTVLRRSISGQRTPQRTSMETRRSTSRKRSSRNSSARRNTQPIPESSTQRIQQALSASREASRESSRASSPHRMRMDHEIPAPEAAPPPPPPPHSPRPMSIDEEEHSSPPHPSHAPPPPPPHSPRPMSINHDYFSEHQAVREGDFVPPPPSHSPRPMDVTPVQEGVDPWAAQADRWRALRRQASHGELHGGSNDHEHGPYEAEVYPSLPPLERKQPNRYTITNGTHGQQNAWEDGFGYKQDRTYSYAHEAWTWDTQGQYHQQQQHYTASPSAWKGYYGNQY
jgi:hypothetical protein